MPFSDWIQSDPYMLFMSQGNWARYVIRNRQVIANSTDYNHQLRIDSWQGAVDGDANDELRIDEFPDPPVATHFEPVRSNTTIFAFLGDTHALTSLFQFRQMMFVGPGVFTFRDCFPPEMFDLIYGTDFEEIPDHDGECEFVEYESDDPNTLLPGGVVRLRVGSSGSGANEIQPWLLKTWVHSGLFEPATWNIQPNGALTATYQVEGVHPTLNIDHQVDVLSFLDGNHRMTAFVSMNFHEFVPEIRDDPDHEDNYQRGVRVAAQVRVLLPRWRYWIPEEPGIPPLRTAGRDDLPRVVGETSFQESIRTAGGYW